MKIVIPICTCILLGYLIGSFNLSYFLAKARGYDIREHGSGNPGASNVVITMGKRAGVLVAIVDILKAYLAVAMSQGLYPDIEYAGVISAAAVILGHIFPFYMGFRGGKGLATLGGSILALDYKLFLILLLFALFIAFITDYICFVPITCSVIFPVVYGYTKHNWWFTAILFIPTLFILWKHMENVKRIIAGKELRLSFLWNRKAEAERMGVEDDGVNYPFEYDETHNRNGEYLESKR